MSTLEDVELDMLATVADEYESRFTRSEELQAQIVDRLDEAVYLLGRLDAANTKKPDQTVKQLRKPQRVPRPGDEQRKPKKRGTTVAELMAMGGGNG